MTNNLSLLKTLTIMQLKEKIDMSFLRSFKKTLFKIVWLIIEIVAITFLIKFAFDYAAMATVFSYSDVVPLSVLTVIFVCMFVFSIIASTSGLTKSLYFARDNMVLLTLPATSSIVFISKLAVYYVYEFRKNFMFTIPMFVAFGMHKGFAFSYYPWLILMFVFISALPVIFGALLSIPFMFAYQWVRKYKPLQYTLYGILGAGLITIVILIVSVIPAEIDLLANWGIIKREIMLFLKDFVTFPLIKPLHAFIELIVGVEIGFNIQLFHDKTLVSFLILLLITAVVFAIVFLLAKPLFYQMASKPFEYNKKATIKDKRNVKTPGFLSVVKKEVISDLRNNRILTISIILLLLLPFSIRVLNLLYMSMSMTAKGRTMTVAFNLMVIMLILLTMNISLASAYSKDGATAYLNKIQPLGYGKILFAKLVNNLVIGLVAVIITLVSYKPYAPLSASDVICFGITIYSVYVAHMFWSAEMDIMNPQYSQFATFSEQANNPNENMSAILAILLPTIFFAVVLLFGGETLNSPWIKITIISVVFAAVKILTYFMKIKAFYKEKQ